MKEFLSVIKSWTNQNKKFAIARVTKTWGSSPRPVGSTMLISEDEEMAGSVSGGCVEASVVKKARELFKSGDSEQLAFGVSDEDAWAVGLSCGGKMEVFLQVFFPFNGKLGEKAIWETLEACFVNNKSATLITRLESGVEHNTLLLTDGQCMGSEVAPELLEQAQIAYQQRKNTIIEQDSGERWFIQIFPKQSQMLIIGAAHITADLIHLAKFYDFEVIVIDPRGTFAHKTHFTTPPDQIIEKYPSEVLEQFDLDPYTYAVVLSHDPKIDDNALQVLLPSNVAYIGALGSKKNQAKRIARLSEQGFTEAELAKIHGPIGMNISAKTPREIALSIMGEIIGVKNKYGR